MKHPRSAIPIVHRHFMLRNDKTYRLTLFQDLFPLQTLQTNMGAPPGALMLGGGGGLGPPGGPYDSGRGSLAPGGPIAGGAAGSDIGQAIGGQPPGALQQPIGAAGKISNNRN